MQNKGANSVPISRVKILLTVVVLACLAVPVMSAQEVAGINFGTAGPNSWGILAVGGTGGTQCSGVSCWSSSGTTLGLNNGGIFGSSTNANVGVADSGKASFSGPETIQGTVYLSTSVTNNISGGVTVGGLLQNSAANTTLSAAASDAASGLSVALSLSCNVGSCGSAINTGGTMGVSGIGTCVVGGTCVLYASSINLNNQTLTLGGGATTNWVIIDSGNMNVQSGGVIQGGGGASNPSNVLVVVDGGASSLSTSGGPNPSIDAVVIVPTGSVNMSSGVLNGEIIVGGATAQIVSGSQVNVPVSMPDGDPGTLTLLVSGLGCCGAFVKHYRSEMSR